MRELAVQQIAVQTRERDRERERERERELYEIMSGITYICSIVMS